MKYWIIVASKDHLQRGLTGGFIQANHGKAASLKRMHQGDFVIFYSPKVEFEKPESFNASLRFANLSMRIFISTIWAVDLSRFDAM